MNLGDVLSKAVANVIESGVIERAAEEQIKKTVCDVLSNELRTYSDFGKRVTEAVKKSLAMHGDIDLPSYNDSILKVLRAQVEHQTNAAIQKQVATHMQELLEPAPEQITLSKLVAKFIEQVKESRSDGCVCYGEDEITLLVNKRDGHFTYIGLDEGAKKSEHQCDIRIGLYKDEVFSLHFGNADLEKQMFVGPLHGVERMLFQMKAARSKLILDCDVHDIDLSIQSHE